VVPKDSGVYVWCIGNNNLLRCRSQSPCSLKRGSAAANLLRFWVRIPPGTWISVCCECCVLSGRDLYDEQITRPEESYRRWCVVVCDLEASLMRRAVAHWGAVAPQETNKPPSLYVKRANSMSLKLCVIILIYNWKYSDLMSRHKAALLGPGDTESSSTHALSSIKISSHAFVTVFFSEFFKFVFTLKTSKTQIATDDVNTKINETDSLQASASSSLPHQYHSASCPWKPVC
jgi:hypothetical protein